MVSPMGSLVFSLLLTLSLCSANALTPAHPPSEVNESVDPYMLGVCEGIASMNMVVTDMQLKRSVKNLLVFSITTSEKTRGDFYCHQCTGLEREDEIIILTSTSDAKIACSEVPQ